MVNDLAPDLIVLTGDFVSIPLLDGDREKAASAAEPCADLLRRMHARHGLWAVMGNHDYYTDPWTITSALQASGIRVLANQSSPIEQDDARFWLAGVNDVVGGTADLDETLHIVPENEATILLAHEPDYADEVTRYGVDLQLSGHSHDGQVRIPLVSPLFLPKLGKKYVWGLYRIGALTLYTNAGVGTVVLSDTVELSAGNHPAFSSPFLALGIRVPMRRSAATLVQRLSHREVTCEGMPCKYL